MVRGSYDVLAAIVLGRLSSVVALTSKLVVVARVLLLCGNTLGALRAVCRVAEGLALLDLLIDDGEVTLQVLGVLLIEGSHAELLVDQGLLLAAGGTVAVVSVVAELKVLIVLLGRGASSALDIVSGVHRAHATEEALLL